MSRPPPFVPGPADAAAAGPSFRARDAARAGQSRRALSGRRLLIPTPSVRSPAPLRDLRERAAAYALALPDDVAFSHLTAARAHGLPLPAHLDRPDDPLDLMRATSKAPIERAGCCSHRGLERRSTVRIGGLMVTDVADTWCDIIAKHHARLSLADAVMLGDAAVERLRPTRREPVELHPRLILRPRSGGMIPRTGVSGCSGTGSQAAVVGGAPPWPPRRCGWSDPGCGHPWRPSAGSSWSLAASESLGSMRPSGFPTADS